MTMTVYAKWHRWALGAHRSYSEMDTLFRRLLRSPAALRQAGVVYS
jgi:hypothetical protein